MDTLLPIILQIIAGAVGGNVGGAAMRKTSLGGLGNSIVGAIGGIGAGQLLPIIVDMATASGLDFGKLAGSAVGGLVLQIVIGLVKAQMNKSK